MKKHLFCLTIDTDPDGLNTRLVNRESLSWEGLRQLRPFPEILDGHCSLRSRHIPITWFVRMDNQIQEAFGCSLFLLTEFDSIWDEARLRGDELGWHPHLYRTTGTGGPEIIADPAEAADALNCTWHEIKSSFQCTAFRNGEGWHLPETLSAVEGFGIQYDSTAIPGRTGGVGHPMNWKGTPNQPYFPAHNDIRLRGTSRPILELPMNTWFVQAPYDVVPKLRYMNPCVHEHIFSNAVNRWNFSDTESSDGLNIWVLICHPDELTSVLGNDMLYGRSFHCVCRNLCSLIEHVEKAGGSAEFVTVSAAGSIWKRTIEGLPNDT